MTKKKKQKKKQPDKPPPKIKYEDTNKFDAYDHMMRSNRGVRLE